MPGALSPQPQESVSGAHHDAPLPAAGHGIEWEKIIDQLPFGLLVLSPKQVVLHESARCRAIVGIGVCESGGVEPWLSALCPDQEHRKKVIASWREHIWRNQLRRTFTLKGSDQKLREIEFRSSLQLDGGITITLQDVTHLRRTEETLRHGKLKFRSLFSHSQMGVVLTDRPGRIIDANRVFLGQSGKKLKELRLTSFYDQLEETDATSLREAEERLISREVEPRDQAHTQNVRLKSETGEQTIELTYCPVGEKVSEPVMGIYLFQFLPEPVESSTPDPRIEAMSQKAQALLNAVPDLILLLDNEGTITDFAAPPEPWPDYRPDDKWIGEPLSSIWPGLHTIYQSAQLKITQNERTIHADIRSREGIAPSHSVSLSPCGSDQILAVIRQIPAPIVESRSVSRFDREWSQHQFRNQIQLVTSLFSLEPQDASAREAFLRWQIRLRAIAQAFPSLETNRVWITPLLRTIADEVCSVSGRGPGRREVIVTGSDTHFVNLAVATPLGLLASEFMRLVLTRDQRKPGPELFFDVHKPDEDELHLTIRLGEDRVLPFSDRSSEIETLQILTEQMQARLILPDADSGTEEWVLVLPSPSEDALEAVSPADVC